MNNTNNTADDMENNQVNASNTDNKFAKAEDINKYNESINNPEEGMSEDEIKSLVNKFITLKKDALLEVAKDYPKKKSLLVAYSELFKFNARLCDELIDFPDKVIRIFEKVINEQNIPINFPGEVKFHVRFTLPKGFAVKIRDITSEYINKFFCVDGVITKVSDVLPKVYVGVFQCPLCGKRKEVYQEKNRNLIVPTICDDCKKAVRFKLLPEESKFVDIQRLEVQEPLEMLRGGEEARKIEIWLTDDLTGKVLPGNTIEVVGVMKLIPPKDINDAVYRKFIDANNVNVIDREFTEVDLSEEDIKKINEFAKSPNIAEKFVSSISPTIYGYKEIKEAIALQLFGGSKFELPDKTKTRSETHLLLIGDPGVAKSKLLIGASNIAPKSIYVSGKGTSAAGLTATAEKDEFAEGAWVLKAGALVLASGGIACLHPETNIIINNEIRSIGEIFDDAAAYKAQNTNDNEVVEINDITAYVPAFNFSDLSVKEEKTIALRKKRYTGKIINIKFESGFNIKLTPEHKIINGNTLKWTPAGELSAGDFVLSPLKLPNNPNRIYLLDIIPDEWKVILDKKEKDELKDIILKKYKSLTEFNRKFGLNRHILSGASQFSVEQFKKIISGLGTYNMWREKSLSYVRKFKPDYINIPYLTPELGYLLGFIYWDGSVFVNKRRTNIQVVQSVKYKEYISKFKECWKSVFGKEPNIYERTSHSVIRRKDVTSENIIMYGGSILLGELYEKFVGKKLKNILLLPDEVLKSFIAGAMDADGCISIKNIVKNGKPYKTVDVEFLLSNDTLANLNFMIALRRFNCYSKLIDTKSNIQYIRIIGRKDILCLKDSIKKYSIKARKEIPDTIHNVSSTSDKLPSDIVSEISKDLYGINATKLVNACVWNTIYAYKEKKYLPSRDQLKKILDRLNDEINPELTNAIELLMHRDFFLDKIKSINEYDFDGFVYDIYVPKVNNFVAEGIFVHNCVDEFDKMEKEDRAAMHEALEQQSYHPNTRILLTDGSEKKIGTIVDALFDERKSEVVQGKNCELLPLKEGELKLFSSDFGKVFETNAIQASRHVAPEKMVKITLSNGRSIIVTPEHPCWVMENGQMETKPAEKITENDFLPIPTIIPLTGEEQEITAHGIDGRTKKDLLFEKFPKHSDADFCRFIGYLASDGGYELNREQKNGVNFTNKDQALIDDFCGLSQKLFGLAPYVRKRDDGVQMARIISMPLLQYLECLDFGVTEKSDKKRIPPILMKSSNADITHLLRALFESGGWATQNRVGFISTNKEECEQVQTLLLRFGITSQLLEQKTSTGKLNWKVDVTGSENLRKFAEHVGFLSARKNEKLAKQLNPASFRTIKDIIPNAGNTCAQIAETLKLNESRVLGYSITPAKKGNGNLSRHALQKFVVAFEQKLGQLEQSKIEIRNAKSVAQLKTIREKLCIAQEDIAKQLGTPHQQISYWETKNKNLEELKQGLLEFIENAVSNASAKTSFLRKLAFGEIAWSKVKKTETTPSNCKWVYDLAVQPTSSFVSECMLLHNSISIAKAGIVAKFRAETCVLAAANPKFGRFSSEKAITDQFDIPPALLSRFDLIFPLRDIMDNTQDQGVANYVLKAYSGKKEELLIPPIDIDFIRKYIAYARKNLNPVVGEDAQKQIEEYYLRLRRESSKDVVQITARQLEGIIRLSCASAKMRLKNVVEKEDVDRAIRLIEYSLNLVARDKETGKIDIDRVTQGPREKRDKLKGLSEILEYLTENGKKHCLIEDFVKQAKEQGIDEKDAKNFIENAKREGKIFEPRDGEIGMIE